MTIALITFSVLAFLFLTADTKKLKKELKELRDNPDE